MKLNDCAVARGRPVQVAHEAGKNGLSCYCLKPSAVFQMPPLFALPEAVVNFEEPLTEAYIFKLNLRAVL